MPHEAMSKETANCGPRRPPTKNQMFRIAEIEMGGSVVSKKRLGQRSAFEWRGPAVVLG